MATVKVQHGIPAELDILVYANDSIDGIVITISDKKTGDPIDLSGFDTMVAQLKLNWADTETQFLFTDTPSDPNVEGDISFVTDGTDGEIILEASYTAMENLGQGEYVYDIQFQDSSRRRTYVRGKFSVSQDITR
jgi:hypothetical protein